MINLNVLQECVDNKKSFFKIIKGKNIKLIIEKYQFLPYFDIRVINLSGTYVINWYQKLYPFDTYNMIQELLTSDNQQ